MTFSTPTSIKMRRYCRMWDENEYFNVESQLKKMLSTIPLPTIYGASAFFFMVCEFPSEIHRHVAVWNYVRSFIIKPETGTNKHIHKVLRNDM